MNGSVTTRATAARARLEGERSTAVYRVLLDALARPGQRQVLPRHALVDGLPAAMLLPLALADLGTSVALAGTGASSDRQPLGEIVRLATLCRIAPATSAGIVVALEADDALLAQLCPGSDQQPEAATKLAVQVDDLEAGLVVRLEGPGVPGSLRTSVGLGRPFLEGLQVRNARPPVGVDTWIFDRHQRVVALPRSTRLSLPDASFDEGAR